MIFIITKGVISMVTNLSLRDRQFQLGVERVGNVLETHTFITPRKTPLWSSNMWQNIHSLFHLDAFELPLQSYRESKWV